MTPDPRTNADDYYDRWAGEGDQALTILAECCDIEQCFVMNTALAGGGTTGHAVAHSEKIVGDTASVAGVDSHGVRYRVTLQRQRSGVWKITQVAGA